MISRIPLFLLAALLAAPAAAQPGIAVGETVSGMLQPDDPVLGDDSHYRLYAFRAEAPGRYVITLRSRDFDAYLAVSPGMLQGPEVCEGCETDNDSGGGTDARVRLRVAEPGLYTIRVNTLEGGETGKYTLTVEPAAERPYPGPQGRLVLGRPVSGALDDLDPTVEDGSFYEDWTFRSTFRGRIRVFLRSTDFDAFLSVGFGTGPAFEPLESNDDWGDGTDSMVEMPVEPGRTYTVRANSLSEGETGAYSLLVERVP